MGPFVDLSISSKKKNLRRIFGHYGSWRSYSHVEMCEKGKKNRTTLQTLLEESTIRASRRHLALPPCWLLHYRSNYLFLVFFFFFYHDYFLLDYKLLLFTFWFVWSPSRSILKTYSTGMYLHNQCWWSGSRSDPYRYLFRNFEKIG